MKRNLIGILSLVVLPLLLNATGAFAQSAVQGNVPFSFTVGKAHLPAGTYIITMGYTSNTIMIQNWTTGKPVIASAAHQEDPRNTSAKLVFHHLGNRYFLTQVFGAAGSTGIALPASKLEQELQRATGPANAGEEVVIALK